MDEELVALLVEYGPRTGALILAAAAVAASFHAVMVKKNPVSAVAWVGVIWLSPVVGIIVYYLLGINRVHRRALKLNPGGTAAGDHRPAEEDRVAPVGRNPLVGYVDQLSDFPVTRGNTVEPLFNGDEAYPAMLEAIAAAKKSVAFSTYIFTRDELGLRFVEAFRQAMERGVQVRIIVDSVGGGQGGDSVIGLLRDKGLPLAVFIPRLIPWDWKIVNLRSHRKMLIIDGEQAFTGGLNIDRRNLVRESGADAIRDVHFYLRGPVVRQIQHAFAEDWHFAAGGELAGPDWFPPLPAPGPDGVLARTVQDGPDINFERIRWVLLGALHQARRSIRIATPYFLPDETLTSQLRVAAMLGIEVEVILPEKSDFFLVQWAAWPGVERLLRRGVRVYLQPGPFDHSKITVVDEKWVFFGSSNWDPRSLRLNFELNVECHDEALARRLNSWFAEKREISTLLDAGQFAEDRSLLIRFRDRMARLFTPYL